MFQLDRIMKIIIILSNVIYSHHEKAKKKFAHLVLNNNHLLTHSLTHSLTQRMMTEADQNLGQTFEQSQGWEKGYMMVRRLNCLMNTNDN